jgi:hypothetical protein
MAYDEESEYLKKLRGLEQPSQFGEIRAGIASGEGKVKSPVGYYDPQAELDKMKASTGGTPPYLPASTVAAIKGAGGTPLPTIPQAVKPIATVPSAPKAQSSPMKDYTNRMYQSGIEEKDMFDNMRPGDIRYVDPRTREVVRTTDVIEQVRGEREAARQSAIDRFNAKYPQPQSMAAQKVDAGLIGQADLAKKRYDEWKAKMSDPGYIKSQSVASRFGAGAMKAGPTLAPQRERMAKERLAADIGIAEGNQKFMLDRAKQASEEKMALQEKEGQQAFDRTKLTADTNTKIAEIQKQAEEVKTKSGQAAADADMIGALARLAQGATDDEKTEITKLILEKVKGNKTAAAGQPPLFKEGDIMEKDGKKYKRDANGKWSEVA